MSLENKLPTPTSNELQFKVTRWKDAHSVGVTLNLVNTEIVECADGTMAVRADFDVAAALILARDIQTEIIDGFGLEEEDE